ncbi:tetratricopeptide repeat protein [Labilibacter marinus]|uniref:tetratricopeptide repeat protein n=1 Tax=Labilibacter marinus TaxID=1477105 RepID=UPI0008327427|nr:LuxR C-terminal-related transcriptional regulator [Labilibacter marinus]
MYRSLFSHALFLFLCKYFLLNLLFSFITVDVTSQNSLSITNAISSLYQHKTTYHDSLLIELPKITKQHLLNGDTINAIQYLIKTSRLNSTGGNYTKAYDGYWEALIYSESINDSSYVSDIYRGLGILYGLYGRVNEAESYFNKSIELQRSLINIQHLKRSVLIDDFYVIASFHRELGNYNIAQSYLDSCWNIKAEYNTAAKLPFLIAEQGRIYYYNKETKKAEEFLLEAEDILIANEKPYLVILYLYLADLYFEQRDYTKSEYYYLKSIDISDTYNAHKNMLTQVYQNIAELYVQMGKLKLAYDYQSKSRELTEQLFDARGKSNSTILEIKDEYRRELDEKAKLLELNKLNELEQEKKILFLKNSVLSISVVSLLLLAAAFYWYLQHKRKTDKLFFAKEQKISSEKNKEIVEIKNKELTSSALQLIHKDELLLEIKEIIAELTSSMSNKKLDDILNKIRINSKQDWNEFDIRFTSINQEFYKSLSNQHPQLTSKDHKLCALIKLNFSSKEISQLLGISMESVNTSRYRLRKKMGLSKSVHLVEYINRI